MLSSLFFLSAIAQIQAKEPFSFESIEAWEKIPTEWTLPVKTTSGEVNSVRIILPKWFKARSVPVHCDQGIVIEFFPEDLKDFSDWKEMIQLAFFFGKPTVLDYIVRRPMGAVRKLSDLIPYQTDVYMQDGIQLATITHDKGTLIYRADHDPIPIPGLNELCIARVIEAETGGIEILYQIRHSAAASKEELNKLTKKILNYFDTFAFFTQPTSANHSDKAGSSSVNLISESTQDKAINPFFIKVRSHLDPAMQ